MSEDRELFDKANALLARYRTSPEPDYPVLTDIVEFLAEESAELAVPRRRHESDSTADILNVEALRQRLEEELASSLTGVLATIIDQVILARLKTELDAVLQRALAEVSNLAKVEMEANLKKFATDFIESEIARLSTRSGND